MRLGFREHLNTGVQVGFLFSGFVDCISVSPPHRDGSKSFWVLDIFENRRSSLYPFPRKETAYRYFQNKNFAYDRWEGGEGMDLRELK